MIEFPGGSGCFERAEGWPVPWPDWQAAGFWKPRGGKKLLLGKQYPLGIMGNCFPRFLRKYLGRARHGWKNRSASP
jgi:hypothetical protein